jgi:hypothetical protein
VLRKRFDHQAANHAACSKDDAYRTLRTDSSDNQTLQQDGLVCRPDESGAVRKFEAQPHLISTMAIVRRILRGIADLFLVQPRRFITLPSDVT